MNVACRNDRFVSVDLYGATRLCALIVTLWLSALSMIGCGSKTGLLVCDNAPSVAPPRQTHPWSAGVVSSFRPLFRWQRTAHADGVEIEVCRDPRCENVTMRITSAQAEAAAPESLSRGGWFWRIRSTVALRGSCLWSPVWEFFVDGNSASSASSVHGLVFDLNRDGRHDIAVGGARDPADRSSAVGTVYLGSVNGPVSPPLVIRWSAAATPEPDHAA